MFFLHFPFIFFKFVGYIQMLADVIVVVSTAQGKSDKLFVERFIIVGMNTFSFALQQLVQNALILVVVYHIPLGIENVLGNPLYV